MTINAANRSVAITAGGDGVRWSKYPAGVTPGTPALSESFNAYSNGAALGGGVVFNGGSRTVADTSIKYGASGASAKMSIRTGDAGGGGKWGGIIPSSRFGGDLAKGDEIWARVRKYWPSSFTFSAAPYMKFLRLRTELSGVNEGYVDLYIDNADGGAYVYRTIKEGQDTWAQWDTAAIPRNQWITYEMYVKLDNVSVDSAGTGRLRVWVDGVLKQDRTDITPLLNAATKLTDFYVFTYWNNETPPDNDSYLDDLTIYTSASPPTATDAGGNTFIGLS